MGTSLINGGNVLNGMFRNILDIIVSLISQVYLEKIFEKVKVNGKL